MPDPQVGHSRIFSAPDSHRAVSRVLHAFVWVLCVALVGFPLTATAEESANNASDAVAASEQLAAAETGVQEKIDEAFKWVAGKLAPLLFFDVARGALKDGTAIPLIVLVLFLGGVFFTFRFGFINLRLFGHSIAIIRGKYDNPKDHGEISHFQALTSALSATVGLGNIAGVAIAISKGGPGALFWMWVIAFFGMSSKFSSCALAQVYRQVGNDEHVLGGPMVYLKEGIKERFGGTAIASALGAIFAISFAIFAILGSLGGGNMFQGNQTFEIVAEIALDGDKSFAWLGGLIMAALVGVVIIGGIRRIGEVTSRLVPAMCVFYSGVCLFIVLANIADVPAMFREIFASAFSSEAALWGGVVGVFVTGATRAAFSNEAGLGSAAIAHSAAKTAEPVREGIVAMIGPFIDTIIVCTMTALAILITESHLSQETGQQISNKGVAITASAFASIHGFLPFLLCIAVFIFAYSTMISWSYYGERASEYLFGKRGIIPYRIVFLIFVVLGPIVSLQNVIDFTDILILSMAYPNIIGSIFLSGKLAALTKNYNARLKSGQMQPQW